jgi:prolyl 4-hydroxylase
MKVVLFDTQKVSLFKQVLDAQECNYLIEQAELIGFEQASVSTQQGAVMMPDYRNNLRVMTTSVPMAAWLWERVAHLLPGEVDGGEVIGLNEMFRFYKYRPGHYFKWHRDGYYQRNSKERSALTMLVYLTGDCRGGETVFSGDYRVKPEQGLVLLFPHAMSHQGLEVLDGTKYVLRTDVMVRYPTNLDEDT